MRKTEELEQVDPDEVEIGTVIVVQPGEKVPIDGVIVRRKHYTEYQCTDRRSVPREATPGMKSSVDVSI